MDVALWCQQFSLVEVNQIGPKSLGWLSKSLVRGDDKFVIGESTDFGQCRTIQLEVSTNLMRGGER